MKNSILFEIDKYLEKTYPKLNFDEVDLIATDIQRRYDYTSLIEQIDEQIKETAYYANIKLESQDDNEGLVHTSEGC
jgi:phage terminase Nu1 subunit (DNA packaging protein)